MNERGNYALWSPSKWMTEHLLVSSVPFDPDCVRAEAEPIDSVHSSTIESPHFQ